MKKELFKEIQDFCKVNQELFPDNKLINFLLKKGKEKQLIHLTRKDIKEMKEDGKTYLVRDETDYKWYLRIKRK